MHRLKKKQQQQSNSNCTGKNFARGLPFLKIITLHFNEKKKPIIRNKFSKISARSNVHRAKTVPIFLHRLVLLPSSTVQVEGKIIQNYPNPAKRAALMRKDGARSRGRSPSISTSRSLLDPLGRFNPVLAPKSRPYYRPTKIWIITVFIHRLGHGNYIVCLIDGFQKPNVKPIDLGIAALSGIIDR